MNFSTVFYSTLLCLSQIYRNEKIYYVGVYQNEIPDNCKEIRSADKVIQNFKKTFNYSDNTTRQYDDLLSKKYIHLNCKKECDDILESTKSLITEIKNGKLVYQTDFENGRFDYEKALSN